jgi:hypothetical protein
VSEFFGPTGEHWLQGAAGDTAGRRCFLGALMYVERKHRASSLAAQDFLKAVTTDGTWSPSLPSLNDSVCESFDDLRTFILDTRDLALEETREPTSERLAA